VNLLRTNRSYKADEYATSEEFRKVFTEDAAGLYLLSFLLTASHERAEQCFVAGLEDCVKRNSVFKEWARSWAKRTIVHNAIEIMAPRPTRASESFAEVHWRNDRKRQETQDQHDAITSVLVLADFDRFVFVMSVLERYTEKECSVLLGCSQQDVREARIRAQRQIAAYTKHNAASQGDAIQSSSRLPELQVQ
jgi:hypothetical protein